MGATIVGQHVEPVPHELLGNPRTGRAVVPRAVKVDDGDAARAYRREEPATQRNTVVIERDVLVSEGGCSPHGPPGGVQERSGTPRWPHAGAEQNEGGHGQARVGEAHAPSYAGEQLR